MEIDPRCQVAAAGGNLQMRTPCRSGSWHQLQQLREVRRASRSVELFSTESDSRIDNFFVVAGHASRCFDVAHQCQKSPGLFPAAWSTA